MSKANDLPIFRGTVINLKSLDQDIPDPIIAGAGEANGKDLTFIFTQEAKAQFTPKMQVYLSWRHEDLENVRGYDIFKQACDDPLVYTISFPQALLQEGKVIARIELVDNISISAGRNFIINVLANPNPSEEIENSESFTLFQQAIIDLTSKINDIEETAEEINSIFTDLVKFYSQIQKDHSELDEKCGHALANSIVALKAAVTALNSITWDST